MRRLRAALYHRVSRVDQDVTLAREELKRAARARGLTVVLDVEEKASGARNDREGLSRVLEAARRHRIDAVLVWKLDRFGRSLLDLVANVRALRAAGVRFVCVSQSIDLGGDRDSASELQFNVLCAVAEYERGVIVERTRIGIEAARRRGVKLGRPRAPVDAHQVAKLRKEGSSWAAIAEQLGVPVMRCRRACDGLRKSER